MEDLYICCNKAHNFSNTVPQCNVASEKSLFLPLNATVSNWKAKDVNFKVLVMIQSELNPFKY